MFKLTRNELIDGSFRESLAMPAHLSLCDIELDESVARLLAARPEGPSWVFAYGSLIWNPAFTFDSKQVAKLDGWHRSFCIRTISARGSPRQPGRVLALEPGGQVEGLAYRLTESDLMAELRLLWAREMGSGVYQPTWETLQLADGSVANAIVFVADSNQPLFECDASVPTVAHLAAKATGRLGSNAEYILNLQDALRVQQITDDYVDAIARELRSAHPAHVQSTAPIRPDTRA
ncbi:gamma-glutamylcyclotransferase [Paraburkholderia sp. J7]|uniref:gamma-glutamylcyclotransferase n=1 Tax=Paraburkholderia sp. J7 TaxID=2805438 RepID=UPI002AB5F013|nr:gamma-glutamylcyclotransferase [Paraburkholderia sp. J7]